MKTKLYTDDYYIADSNTVMLFNKNSDFVIDIDTEFDFKFKIRFVFEDNADEKIYIDKEVINNFITYKCVNFNTELGTSTTEPIQLGIINGKQYYIHLRILVNHAGIRVVNYTILIEK